MTAPSGRSEPPMEDGNEQFRQSGKGSGIPEADQQESLSGIIRVLRVRYRTIFWCALGALALTVLACIFYPHPSYKATATLLVDKDNSSGLDMDSVSEMTSALGGTDETKMDIDTQIAVMESDTTELTVVDKLGLEKVDGYGYFPNKIHINPMDWNPELKAEVGRPLEQAPATRERLLKKFNKALKVEAVEDTRLISIKFSDENPNRAADVANTLVNVYILEYLQTHFHATATASDWLTAQLNELKAKVDQSQQKLAAYESKTGLSVLMLGLSMSSSGSGSSGGSSPSLMSGGGVHIPEVDRLAALNAELTGAEADLIAKEAIYHLTQTQSPEVVLGLNSSTLSTLGSGSSVTNGGGLELLQTLRQQEMALRTQYGDALSKYGSKNPHLDEIKGQLSEVENGIHDELGRINQRAKNDVEMAQKAQDALRQDYSQQQGVVNKLNDSTIELEELADDAMSNRMLYDELYSKLQEAKVEAGTRATNLDLIDVARAPALPSTPNYEYWPPIGLGAGLVLGIALAFVRENLDDSIVTTDEVEAAGRFPVLSYLPLDRTPVTERGKSEAESEAGGFERSPLITRSNSPEAEAYRVLRTSIMLSAVDQPLRTILLTSPMVGDGKTTVSYNLAISFALHGGRVLVIDADMRKARMHVLFKAKKSPGLSEVLTGGISLNKAIFQHHAVENLFLLGAGTVPPNPSELLDSKRFDALIEEAKGQFDYVIIDSPPTLLVTDPVLISKRVDGTIIVVRSRKTTRLVLKRVGELLSRSRGRKLGFVVNGIDTKSIEYYYSYGHYGDDKYYGEEA